MIARGTVAITDKLAVELLKNAGRGRGIQVYMC
jgi:hypothetical protein